MKGGEYPTEWGFKRRIFSQWGGLFARFILFFPTKYFSLVTDPTTGLKATKVLGLYNSMDLSSIKSRGYAYKVEMLYKFVRMGANIREIPLKFQLREQGKSKITPQTAKEVLLTIFQLRFQDESTRRFFKFGIVGFIGFLINAVCLELLNNMLWIEKLANSVSTLSFFSKMKLFSQPASWAAAIAAEFAILSNYLLNNIWTFRKYRLKKIGLFLLNAIKFNLTSFGTIIAQFVTVGMATLLISNTLCIRQITLVLTIILVVVPYNWFMYNYFIWKTKC